MRPISMYFCLLYAAVTESYEINIEGFEGEQTSFLCSHKLASSRKKYFCKDPCNKDEDILATVVPGGRTVKGRLSLKDFGDGVFSVTFNPLQLSDTHLYYCAVERLGFVTYTSVDIRVQKALTTPASHVSSTFPPQPVSSSAPLFTNSTMEPTNSSTATIPPENEEKVNWDSKRDGL
ncbi:uncharacterized protein LOC105355073 isoform X2 [Oryzias latipes]|uniref:uncharacterized protein LOC105355073 isoform X2 n=1 Tax=Oryzias latipes TaxID=8090 RepID=UPI0009DA5DDF|nr:uncharacterized protein LOC105355073 isoform X2 [Oryzias latipes]